MCFNRLEEVSYVLFPELKKIKDDLEILSSLNWIMTGSGSTLYTFISCENKAEKIAALLKIKGYRVKKTITILKK